MTHVGHGAWYPNGAKNSTCLEDVLKRFSALWDFPTAHLLPHSCTLEPGPTNPWVVLHALLGVRWGRRPKVQRSPWHKGDVDDNGGCRGEEEASRARAQASHPLECCSSWNGGGEAAEGGGVGSAGSEWRLKAWRLKGGTSVSGRRCQVLLLWGLMGTETGQRRFGI